MPFGINEVRRAIDRVELKVAIGSHGCPPKAIAAVLAVPGIKRITPVSPLKISGESGTNRQRLISSRDWSRRI